MKRTDKPGLGLGLESNEEYYSGSRFNGSRFKVYPPFFWTVRER